jgi:CAAX prenyl protease-like protein
MNDWIAKRPWFPYVAPMALYFVFLQAQTSWPQLLEVWYPLKAIAVAATLWWLRGYYVELKERPTAAVWLPAFLIGLLAIGLWILLDPFYPKLGELFQLAGNLWRRLTGEAPVTPEAETVYDPTLLPALRARLFIAFRVAGAVLVVPVMEELFWRAFLIRWLANEDFKTVPLGTFTWLSFGSTVFLFGVEHSQWLAGLICGALYNWLFYRTKSVFACVIAHAVSNAALAAWVLGTGDWKFW